MTLESLSPGPEERARQLIERVHGPALAAACPLVFGAPRAGRFFALEEQGQPVSACTLLVRDVVIGQLSLRVGLIGAAATDPAHRRRGVATRMLARAADELFHEGCTLALLWPEDPRCYVARGFQPVGAQLEFLVEPAHIARFDTLSGIRAAAPDDTAVIHRLYSRHRERVDRTLDEMRALLGMPGVETLGLQLERDVVAYASASVGRDLVPTIGEWAGAEHHVLALVRAHVERRFLRGDAATMRVRAPAHARELKLRMHEAGVGSQRGVLAHAMLLDVHAGALLVAELAGNGARATIDCAMHGGRTRTLVKLHGPRGSAAFEEGDLLELLVPPRGDRRRVEEAERALGLELAALPLAARVWSLDSI
jgi:GNAT superfamily N-acetyltransferase